MTLNKDIDQIFREGLQDHSEKPPGFIWDNIEQNLNQKRLNRRRNIVYSIAASIALLISFGAGYLLTNVQNNDLVASNSSAVNNHILSADNSASEAVNNVQEKEKTVDVKNNKKKEVENTNNKSNLVEDKQLDKSTNTPENKKTEKKSNIRKVNSGGTLLPPIYASNNNTKENNKNEIEAINNELRISQTENTELVAINRLKLKNMDLPEVETSKQLAYDDRLLFNPYDFAMAAPKEKKDFSTWSVGVAAAPLVSYRDIVNVSSEAVYAADNNASYATNYSNEKPLTSYSAGVNVNYKVSKRFKIQSGVYYSEMGQVSENIAINNEPIYANASSNDYSINTSVANIELKGNQNQIYYMVSDESVAEDRNLAVESDAYGISDPVSADFIHTYDFYEIPVVANYTVIDRKLAMNVSGGLSANILNSNKAYVQNNGDKHKLDADASGINSFTYSGIVALGFEYPLIDRLMVNLQPTFRYSLNSINNSGEVYPYSFGVYTGLRYSF